MSNENKNELLVFYLISLLNWQHDKEVPNKAQEQKMLIAIFLIDFNKSGDLKLNS